VKHAPFFFTHSCFPIDHPPIDSFNPHSHYPPTTRSYSRSYSLQLEPTPPETPFEQQLQHTQRTMPVHRLMENNRGSDSVMDALADLRTEAAQIQSTCTCPPLAEQRPDRDEQDLQMDVDTSQATGTWSALPRLTNQLVDTPAPPSSQPAVEEEADCPTLLEFFFNKDREHHESCPCHPGSLPMAKFLRRVKDSFGQMGATLPPHLDSNEKRLEHQTRREMLMSTQIRPSDPFAPMRTPSTQTGHLYSGSQFRGKQRSNSHSYDVMVDIKVIYPSLGLVVK
jgi:hypothetical protein